MVSTFCRSFPQILAGRSWVPGTSTSNNDCVLNQSFKTLCIRLLFFQSAMWMDLAGGNRQHFSLTSSVLTDQNTGFKYLKICIFIVNTGHWSQPSTVNETRDFWKIWYHDLELLSVHRGKIVNLSHNNYYVSYTFVFYYHIRLYKSNTILYIYIYGIHKGIPTLLSHFHIPMRRAEISALLVQSAIAYTIMLFCWQSSKTAIYIYKSKQLQTVAYALEWKENLEWPQALIYLAFGWSQPKGI